MRHWFYIVLAAAVVAGALYVYAHRGGLAGLLSRGDGREEVAQPDGVRWRMMERPDEGFRVELPAEAREFQVPAYNESGQAEAVKMVTASPQADITFAVAWDDNPPVARGSRMPEKTLNMARDGMLARTRTMIVSESHGAEQGNPTLDLSARNAGGGVLDARLIYTDHRLYMLTAVFPSTEARGEKDVKRFFDSFATAGAATTPHPAPGAERK